MRMSFNKFKLRTGPAFDVSGFEMLKIKNYYESIVKLRLYTCKVNIL